MIYHFLIHSHFRLGPSSVFKINFKTEFRGQDQFPSSGKYKKREKPAYSAPIGTTILKTSTFELSCLYRVLLILF